MEQHRMTRNPIGKIIADTMIVRANLWIVDEQEAKKDARVETERAERKRKFEAMSKGNGKGPKGKKKDGGGKKDCKHLQPPSDERPPIERNKKGAKGRPQVLEKDANGNMICRSYNNSGCTKTDCKYLHKCNGKMKDGRACLGTHPSQTCLRCLQR